MRLDPKNQPELKENQNLKESQEDKKILAEVHS
jgi:hypothetical protein